MKIGAKTDKGSIEIELKGPANKKNIIITRTFQVTDKTNTFTINGKSATMKAVQEKVRELNVQVDNLWYVGLAWRATTLFAESITLQLLLAPGSRRRVCRPHPCATSQSDSTGRRRQPTHRVARNSHQIKRRTQENRYGTPSQVSSMPFT